jgi:[protein-PII] uridylyltransferase
VDADANGSGSSLHADDGVTPGDRRVGVVTTPGEHDDRWVVEVTAADRPGLLARMAAVLTAARLDIEGAATTTSADGTVTGTFWCHCRRRPTARALADALEASLRSPLPPRPVTVERIQFDNSGVELVTLCVIETDDRPGLLAAVATALTLAGVDVYRADVTTERGWAKDRFVLAARDGGRLDNAAMGRVRRALSGH